VFIPMFMLEIDAPMAVYLVLALKWYPKLYHANVKTNFGLFKYVMVTPQSHRIHHSIDPRHRDKNFGVVFSFWDRMFGTLYPHYDEYPETGITDHRFPLEQDIRGMNLIWNYLHQLAYPFVMVYRQLEDTALTSARSNSDL
jgi:sterol desaturase/sphingolipid hydroxylase (fatty acid hydroxylase superfamily)